MKPVPFVPCVAVVLTLVPVVLAQPPVRPHKPTPPSEQNRHEPTGGDHSPTHLYEQEMLAAVEREEAALAKLKSHPVGVGVNLIFAQGAFVKHIPVEHLLAAVDALAEAGVKRVDVNPSVAFWAGAGDAEAVKAYKRVAARVREKKMGLAVNPLNQGTHSPAKTLADYQKACVAAFPKMVADLDPDTFVVLHEPSTMARHLGIKGTPAEWAGFAAATAEAVRKEKPKVRVGVGGLGQDRKVIEAMFGLNEIDTITLDVYGLKSLNGDKGLAEEARKAGKRVYIEETWRPAVEAGPKGVTPKPGAGIGSAEFEKLDEQWVKMAHRYAGTGPFEEVTYFWSNCFFLYEKGAVSGEDVKYQQAAAKAAAEGKRTATYEALKQAAGGK